MRGIDEYRTTAVHTAPKETLLLMLLESALEKQDLAISAIEAGDRKGARAFLAHTRQVYSELMLCLDHAVAPELSARLSRLYVWCIRELAKAGTGQDAERVRGVQRVTESLLETWSEAIEGAA